MMWRASSLLALMTLALVAPGAGGAARAADDSLAQQLAAFDTQPDQPGEDGDRAAGETHPAQPLLLSQDQASALGSAPHAAPTPPQADEDTEASPGFLFDLPPETETFSMDTGETYQYEAPAERSWEPRNFKISDSLKLKAQPVGGGTGGRVTLTYSFDSGY